MRLGETYRNDIEIAKKNQEASEKELAGAVAQSQEANQLKVTLRQLESSAKTYRAQYDGLLENYTEIGGQQSFPITEARMMTPAEFRLKVHGHGQHSGLRSLAASCWERLSAGFRGLVSCFSNH